MQYQLTQGNWLQYTVDGEPFGTRTSQYQRFEVQFPQIKHDEYPGLRMAHIQNAQALLQAFVGYPEVVVFLSGGLDSHIALHYLSYLIESMQLSVRLRAVTIVFDEDLNRHEVERTFGIQHRLTNVEHQLIPHNVHRFVQSGELEALSKLYQCSQIAYLTVLKYARRFPDAVVVMGGEVLFQKHWKDGVPEWYYVYREDEDAATYRYTQIHQHPVVNEYFSYTPTLLRTWLNLPEVRAIFQDPTKLSLVSSKNRIAYKYLQHYIRLSGTESPIKYHGYEKLLYENQAWQWSLKKDLLMPQDACIPLKEVYRKLCLNF